MSQSNAKRNDDPLRQQRFGAHQSIAGGVHLALESAAELGFDCVQIFVKNQQQWSAPPLSEEALARWRDTRRGAGIEPVIAHATYLINLASPERAMWRKSVDAFTTEIKRCAALDVKEIVIHPGSHKGAGREAGIERIVEAVDAVCDETKGSGVRILLENTAGSGDQVGGPIEDLGRIIDRSRHKRRLGVCVDTCHVFAAGYDIRSAEGYENMVTELDRHVGLKRVRCIHLNDAKRELGSHVDRHEHIGKGKIGRAGFRHLVNDTRLAHVPKILETPKGEDGRGRNLDKMNLAKLRRMIGGSKS